MSLDLQSPGSKGKKWPDAMNKNNFNGSIRTTPRGDAFAFASPSSQGVQNLKVRSDIHLPRRIWHFFGVLTIVAIFNMTTRQTSLTLLVLAILILVPLDLMRTKTPWLNRIALNWFDAVIRSSEVHSLSGLSYLLFGTLITVSLFPHNVVTLALLLLAIGDPTSSIVGILYGKDKIIGNKSLQGAVGGFIACTIMSTIFFLSFGVMAERVVLVALLSGFVGAIAELLPIGRLDDNLTFPVIAASLLWVLFYLFGGFV
jgi:dolichol kinase